MYELTRDRLVDMLKASEHATPMFWVLARNAKLDGELLSQSPLFIQSSAIPSLLGYPVQLADDEQLASSGGAHLFLEVSYNPQESV